MKNLSKKIVNQLKLFLKKSNYNLHEPELNFRDLHHLNQCFKSGMISTAGKYVTKFENEIKKTTKSKYVVSVTSGTVGLFISLKVLNIKKNDEVIVPAITFVATANAVAQCDAIPHFADIENTTFGIDATKLDKYLSKATYIKKNICYNRKTKKIIRAIIPVHIFGHPCKIDQIIKVAKKYKLAVIEDAAEAIGSFYKKRHVGNFGAIGVLSFNGNKIITCGGGGAVITNNKILYKKIKHICSTAKVNHPYRYIHDEIAYNFRLPAINAALGYAQILRLKKLITKKTKLYKIYKKIFSNINDVDIVNSPKNCSSNFWLQTIRLSNDAKKFKTKIIKECQLAGLKVRPLWDILPKLRMYKNCPSMNLDNSKKAYDTVINIPSSSSIIK